MIQLVWNKNLLVLGAFTVDALNTMVTFPLFVANGPRWVLQTLDPKAEKKSDDPNTTTALDDVDRKSFQQLWDLFLIAYEGYFGFTVSSLVCMYQVPKTIPIFAYSLFGLYSYKLYVMLTKFDRNDPDRRAKIYSVLFFFLPCYGGFCAVHLGECVLRK